MSATSPGAQEALIRIRSGALSAVELMSACLERIQSRNPTLQSWASVMEEGDALALARRRDVERAGGSVLGALHALPIGIKDVIDTEELPTEYGSPIYRGRRPARDAKCVARLRAAGAVIVGKTVTCEFANYPPSRTRNPHDFNRTPGGSSSGSAASVADGHVPVALGTQTAGSIIRPAAFNGVIGFKPTFGAYGLDGVLRLAPSLDTVGFFARRIDDLQLIHGVLDASPGGSLRTTYASAPPRIGVVRTPWWDRGEPDMRAAFLETASILRAAGARVVELDLELAEPCTQLLAAHDMLFTGEGARSFSRESREYPDRIDPRMRDKLLIPGTRVSDSQLEQAGVLAADWRSRWEGLVHEVDVLLTPAALGEAPVGLESTGDPIFNRVWTTLHLPCLSYPVGPGPNRMPLAVQVVGKLDRDNELLAHAGWMARYSMRMMTPEACK